MALLNQERKGTPHFVMRSLAHTGQAVLKRMAWQSILALLLIALISPPGVRAEQAQPIDNVKAAFIYKFANFVEWPPSAFQSKDSPLTIGAVATDDFVRILKDAVDGKTVNGRKIEVVAASSATDLKGCQIAYLSAAKEDVKNSILGAIQDQTILTIGDSDDFVDSGGIIKLFEEKNRLRFEINLDAAKRAQLKISSKLLDLASAVKGNASLESE